MVLDGRPIKIYDSLIKRAKKFVGSTKDYSHLTHFANIAVKEKLEKLEEGNENKQ